MEIEFHKYHGAGNDFVIIHDKNAEFEFSKKEVESLCSRRFGIGADGLIIITNPTGIDFSMKYYNADGKEGTLCGNGGRCAVGFAFDQGMISNKCNFLASDGPHVGEIEGDLVKISMKSVLINNGGNILDTGSPHLIKYVENLESHPVFKEGKEIRNQDTFAPDGINVNFVQKINEDSISIRTYERGVENETYACGTGATACAISTALKSGLLGRKKINVSVLGGKLEVFFNLETGQASDVWLKGPYAKVYSGEFLTN